METINSKTLTKRKLQRESD